jgi:pimeloyl-ACP methyl ester carboxylesterase
MIEYFELSHGPVHFKDYGGSGQPILLVHGLGGSIANWDLVGPRLTSLGRVVAIDLPGFGLSPPGPDWSLETHAGTVIDAIQHLGTPVVLVGNSMGALLSEIVAARRPDLVTALALICPATPPRLPDPDIHWPMARRLLIQAIPILGPVIARRLVASMTPRELVNETLERISHKPGRIPLETVDSFVELVEKRRHFPWAPDAIPKTGQSIRKLFLDRARFVRIIG